MPVERRGTLLDCLCAALEAKMQFAPGERDMVLLQHKFRITWPDGRKELRSATLLEYGTPNGYSAMARLVGVPGSVATQFILDGAFRRFLRRLPHSHPLFFARRLIRPPAAGVITERGVLAPLAKHLYEPLLRELAEKHNIACVEESLVDDE